MSGHKSRYKSNPCSEIPLYKFNEKQIMIFEENGFVSNDKLFDCFEKQLSIKNCSCSVYFCPNSNSSALAFVHYINFEIHESVNIQEIIENLDLICSAMLTHVYEYRIASFEYNSRNITAFISVNIPADKDGVIMVIDNGFHIYSDNKLSADEVLFLHTEEMNKNNK